MGNGESKSLTGSGIKYISQYFILNLLLVLAILLFSIGLFINDEDLIEFSLSSPEYVAIVIFLFIFIFLWLIRGLKDIFNGRKEFDDKHETSVVYGTILIIVYIFLFLITIAYSKGLAGGTVIIATAATGFSPSFLVQFIVTITLSAASHILFGLAILCFIIDILPKEQRKRLWIAFGLIVISSFTFSITGLIALALFFKSYRETYYILEEGKLKVNINAPCPSCNKDIPIESKACSYCGAQFEKDATIEIDPRLTIEAPKSRFEVPKGYTPVEGPSEEEKNKLVYLIGAIIVVIIVVSLIVVLF